MEGIQILDALLIAKEAIDSRRRTWSTSKLDTEKAYHVNWKFLLSIMENMGLRKKWVGWIKFCVSCVRGKGETRCGIVESH